MAIINSFPSIYVVLQDDDRDQGHAHKRPRNYDPGAASREWFPWPDKIVGLFLFQVYYAEYFGCLELHT